MSRNHIAYAVVTVLVCIAFVGSGIANLMSVPHVATDMQHLGYPHYFSLVLGAWKVLGAIATAIPGTPRLKEWAYAGMMFDLTGAVVSRIAVGDGAANILPPLFVAALVLASWGLRPASRALRI